MALQVFLADLKDIFDSCGVREKETIGVLAYLLGNDAIEVNETNATYGMSTDAHICHETSLVIFNDFIQHFLTNTALQEEHNLVTRAFQRPKENKLEF